MPNLSDCRYGPKGPPLSGPSSQSRPNHLRSSNIDCSNAFVDRSTSVSSILKTNCPAFCLAKSQLNKAALAFPMCKCPVGLGANLTRILLSVVISFLSIQRHKQPCPCLFLQSRGLQRWWPLYLSVMYCSRGF